MQKNAPEWCVFYSQIGLGDRKIIYSKKKWLKMDDLKQMKEERMDKMTFVQLSFEVVQQQCNE